MFLTFSSTTLSHIFLPESGTLSSQDHQGAEGTGRSHLGGLGHALCPSVPQPWLCHWLKPSPALEALGHSQLLGLVYNHKTWAYPMSTVLATVAFLLLLDARLLSQAGITHYSQQLTLQHSTKLFFFFFFFS